MQNLGRCGSSVITSGYSLQFDFSHVSNFFNLPDSVLLQGSNMWRKPGEKSEKKLEEEWQEPSTAPIGLLELVIHRDEG